MLIDGLEQVGGPPGVEEEEPQPEPPQRRRAELISAGGALGDVVRQLRSHAMNLQVAEKPKRGIAEARGDARGAGGERFVMAGLTTDRLEELLAVLDRRLPARDGEGPLDRRQQAHEHG